MTAQWVDARILKRGWSEYRLTIADWPAAGDWAAGEWTVVEEQSVCLDGSTDRAALETQLAQLCEPYVSHSQAKKLLADLRGHVLGQTPVLIEKRKYATILPRIGSRITDGLIFTPIVLLGTFLFVRSSVGWLHVAFYITLQIGVQLYEILMLGIYGQTLGKMACNVVVRDISERPLSMKQAVLRNVLNLIVLPFGIWFYLPSINHPQPPLGFSEESLGMRLFFIISFLCGWADILTIFVNDKRRALHDYIAGSVVIRTEADASFAAANR
jgi:uncharacterized RDD family membrane protein YckC